MLFPSVVLLLSLFGFVIGQDPSLVVAPDDCYSQNAMSASAYERCYQPVTAFATCSDDNRSCACSNYSLLKKCLESYCPGDQYLFTAVLSNLCSNTGAFDADTSSSTPTSVSVKTTDSSKASSVSAASKPSTSGASITGASTTGVSITEASATRETLTQPATPLNTNAAGHLARTPVGGLLAIAAAFLW